MRSGNGKFIMVTWDMYDPTYDQTYECTISVIWYFRYGQMIKFKLKNVTSLYFV